MRKKGIVIYAFIATGKSFLANIDDRFCDLESSKYHYLDYKKDSKKEINKGLYKIVNPNWPNNYYRAIDKAKKKYDYVLVAHEGLVYCQSRNYNYILVYPTFEQKTLYLQRLNKRKNDKMFIKNIEEKYDRYLQKVINDNNPNCIKKIQLKNGQYLADVVDEITN